jgi:hypothetical protein
MAADKIRGEVIGANIHRGWAPPGQLCSPNFDTAVALHRLIDTVREASNQGRELAVPRA